MADRTRSTQQQSVPAAARGSVQFTDFCIANLDTGLRVLEANADFLHHLGRSASEVYGKSFIDFVQPSVKGLISQHLARLSTGKRDRFTARMVGVRPSYAVFSGDITGAVVRKETGEVSAIVVLFKPDRAGEAVVSPMADKRKMLSELDARVLEGVATGISTVQLASKLYLSRQGIEYHVGAMLRRFKSPNRSALVSKAYSQGILCVGQWPPKVTPEYIR